jgi:hypothetical protein
MREREFYQHTILLRKLCTDKSTKENLPIRKHAQKKKKKKKAKRYKGRITQEVVEWHQLQRQPMY